MRYGGPREEVWRALKGMRDGGSVSSRLDGIGEWMGQEVEQVEVEGLLDDPIH